MQVAVVSVTARFRTSYTCYTYDIYKRQFLPINCFIKFQAMTKVDQTRVSFEQVPRTYAQVQEGSMNTFAICLMIQYSIWNEGFRRLPGVCSCTIPSMVFLSRESLQLTTPHGFLLKRVYQPFVHLSIWNSEGEQLLV